MNAKETTAESRAFDLTFVVDRIEGKNHLDGTHDGLSEEAERKRRGRRNRPVSFAIVYVRGVSGGWYVG